jgi:membrane glycosyltransferase
MPSELPNPASTARRRVLLLAALIASGGGALWLLLTVITALIEGEGHGPIFWAAIVLLVLLMVGLFVATLKSWTALRKARIRR